MISLSKKIHQIRLVHTARCCMHRKCDADWDLVLWSIMEIPSVKGDIPSHPLLVGQWFSANGILCLKGDQLPQRISWKETNSPAPSQLTSQESITMHPVSQNNQQQHGCTACRQWHRRWTKDHLWAGLVHMVAGSNSNKKNESTIPNLKETIGKKTRLKPPTTEIARSLTSSVSEKHPLS